MSENLLAELKNISAQYRKTEILHNISFTIPANKATVIIGPNGAGKTTLIKSLLSVIPFTGSVSYHKNIQFAYAPEESALYPELTAGYFLNWIKKIRHISSEQLQSQIELFELQNHLHKKIKTLSKGYKRRLNIIQAVSGPENFIILDEPTDGLDIEFKFRLRDILKQRLTDKTILICSHESIILNHLADKIIILDKGRKLFDGQTDGLKSQDGKLYIEDIYMRIKNSRRENKI